MTIRLEKTNGTTYANSRGVRLVIQSTVAVDTEAEALEAKRAFENVLAPRFTRDEAIALCKAAMVAPAYDTDYKEHAAGFCAGMRAALEALAAAGAFSDSRCAECRDDHRVMTCEACGKQTMSDRLDAAGIR